MEQIEIPPPPPPSPPPLQLDQSYGTIPLEPHSQAGQGDVQKSYEWQSASTYAGSPQQYLADMTATYTDYYQDYSIAQETAPHLPTANPLPPAKRQKTDDSALTAALVKIGSHISNAKKFLKASALLRQLFTEGKLSGAHGDLVFGCLKAAMRGRKIEALHRVDLRKEYIKLFSVASANSHIFSVKEKLQLDVYGLQAVLQGQIQTDDSFVLNRILVRLKESIQHLPPATEDDDQVLHELEARNEQSEACQSNAQDANQQQSNQLEATWSEQESLCMKRDALVSCLETAKELHAKQWARTSIEIAYEEATKHLEKFCKVQRPRLEALGQFARGQRIARQQGRAVAKEDRRDRTAFETARKEWSQVTGISNRKAVGGGGDHRSEVWLG